MKHGKKILKIGRDASHRKATLQSMSAALLEHKRITTTFGKAKALRRFVEPVITLGKNESTHGRRQAFKKLNDKEAVKRLYDEVAPEIGDRPGGYTRIVKLGQRAGDAAEMAVVELVDFNDVKPDGSSGSSKKTRRSRGGRRGNNTSPTVSSTEAKKAEAKAAAAADQSASDQSTGAPESQAAEAATTTAANPDATGNPQVPTQGANPDHGDSEQGAVPGIGEPPPEAHQENQGRSADNR